MHSFRGDSELPGKWIRLGAPCRRDQRSWPMSTDLDTTLVSSGMHPEKLRRTRAAKAHGQSGTTFPGNYHSATPSDRTMSAVRSKLRFSGAALPMGRLAALSCASNVRSASSRSSHEKRFEKRAPVRTWMLATSAVCTNAVPPWCDTMIVQYLYNTSTICVEVPCKAVQYNPTSTIQPVLDDQ